MFPLYQKNLPASSDELAAVLEASLRRALTVSQHIVALRGKTYPNLEEIAINLDNAKLRMDVAHPRLPKTKGNEAINAERLSLTARPLLVGAASLNLTINASDVALHKSRNEDGEIFLLLHRAANGRIAISISQEDLETLSSDIATTEAAKQGVVVEEVHLTLTSSSARSFGIEVRLRARKLFLRASIRIAGRLELDEQLVARISNLTCTGEGAIATLACNVLNPYLRKLDGREFPLMALPLGEVQLRDVKLDTADGIKVIADFGATASARTT
jgi:hypothetical protein